MGRTGRPRRPARARRSRPSRGAPTPTVSPSGRGRAARRPGVAPLRCGTMRRCTAYAASLWHVARRAASGPVRILGPWALHRPVGGPGGRVCCCCRRALLYGRVEGHGRVGAVCGHPPAMDLRGRWVSVIPVLWVYPLRSSGLCVGNRIGAPGSMVRDSFCVPFQPTSRLVAGSQQGARAGVSRPTHRVSLGICATRTDSAGATVGLAHTLRARSLLQARRRVVQPGAARRQPHALQCNSHNLP